MNVRAGATPVASAGNIKPRFQNGYRGKPKVGQVAASSGGVPIARSAVSTVVKPIGSTVGAICTGSDRAFEQKTCSRLPIPQTLTTRDGEVY